MLVKGKVIIDEYNKLLAFNNKNNIILQLLTDAIEKSAYF